MENRNVIETVVHTALTKRELIDLINKSFPDEEVGNHGQIAQLSTTTMSDGTKMQNVCFGKQLLIDSIFTLSKEVLGDIGDGNYYYRSASVSIIQQ